MTDEDLKKRKALRQVILCCVLLMGFFKAASAIDWSADDCYKYETDVLAGTTVSVYANITLGPGAELNYTVLFNDSEVCRYDYAFNGTNICDVNTSGMYGNYSAICNFSDTVTDYTIPDGWIFVDTTTTITTSTTTTTIAGNTTTTTLHITHYDNLTLILTNDSFDYMICYDELNNCYNKSDPKLINKDYMIYLMPYPHNYLDQSWIVIILSVVLFGTTLLGFLLVFAVLIYSFFNIIIG